MGIPSVSATLPQLNTLSSGTLASSPSSLSTPAATGYSMADTFEAAPQRAAGYGGAGSASSGYSSGGYGAPASGVQGAAPAGVAGAGGGVGQQLQAIIQQVGQIQQLVEKVGTSVAGTGAAGPGAVGLSNVTGDPGLQQAMQEIARDPEGAKLVQAAQAQGLKLQVGNLPPGVMGQHLNGTITISPRAQQSRQDLIHTLAHELGHAATRNDGNSLTEEQTVDQLAQRIQQRIAPGPTFQLDIGSYRGLPQDNGVRNSLAQIGL